MAGLDDLISKVPRPFLIFIVFVVALILIIYNNPLKNGCDVQISNFKTNVSGYLTNYRDKNKKLNIAQMSAYKDFCKRGNSQGACENYLNALQKISLAFVSFDYQCLTALTEQESFASLVSQLEEAIKIMSLLAWGEGQIEQLVSNKLGWLSTTEVYTFCRFKNVLNELISEEEYKKFELSIVKEFPGPLPENLKIDSITEEVSRPTVYKWSGNPSGTMSFEEIRQRSLLSLRCDAYL